jgi:Uncharacterized conserved protein
MIADRSAAPVPMPLLLDKLLSVFAFPLGASLVALLCGLLAAVAGWRRSGMLLASLAVLWLWACSTPLVAGALVASLEDPWPPVPVAALPEAELVVVLGGGMAPPPAGWPHADLGPAADRYWHAARIYHAGRAPRILISGGNVWERDQPTEAEVVRGFLEDLGVPSEAIVEEGSSRNTHENAERTAALLAEHGWRRVLLVTSASHMGRARATFARAGVDTVAAATDHTLPSAVPPIMTLLPQVGALEASTRAQKEYLGRLVYRLRGWI